VVHTRGVILVITGPIASGKSTVARELARQLESSDVRVAVIDLDLVHDALTANGSPPGDESWALARRWAASEATAFVRDGVAVVIAEGSFNLPSDRAVFAAELEPENRPVYVTLQVSFEEALRRAQRDPTRGRSRDRRFLEPYFAARRDVLAAAPATDIVINTEQLDVTAAAAAIRQVVLSSSAAQRAGGARQGRPRQGQLG
jgi:adenylylsulfate kinase-like enzyme